MKKIGFSLLFSMLVLGYFATATFATSQNMTPDTTVGTVNENANKTGVGADTDGPVIVSTELGEVIKKAEVIKSVDGHKTHGDYQHNTNSCASCHQTHTAKTGSRLLFADNNFKTCVACHDGTLGFYNVFETGDNASLDGAGTFGGSHAASVHMANGSLKVNAAPGGSRATSGVWDASFTCASCHAPHGSYSDRLLHNNPNGFATNPQVTAGNNTFGNYLQNIPVSTTQVTGMHLRKIELDKFVKDQYGNETTEKAFKFELFNGANKVNGPWLYGYASNGGPHFTRLQNGIQATISNANSSNSLYYNLNAGVYFSLANGYIETKTVAGNNAVSSMTHASIARPYIVKLDLVEVKDIDGLKIYKTNQAAFWDGANIPVERRAEFIAAGYNTNLSTGRTTNMGVAMSTYCATCHTDYFTSRSNSGRTYFGDNGTAAQRHSTNSDRFTCVRCHYAHGTDAEIMFDAKGNTVSSLVTSGMMSKKDAINHIADVNPSSALKKYTNMTSCWACHSNASRATPFKNTDKRQAADAQNPAGMPIVGGVQR